MASSFLHEYPIYILTLVLQSGLMKTKHRSSRRLAVQKGLTKGDLRLPRNLPYIVCLICETFLKLATYMPGAVRAWDNHMIYLLLNRCSSTVDIE